MLKYLSLWTLLFMSVEVVLAQKQELFYEGFENIASQRKIIGVQQSALNLTSSASIRTPLKYVINPSNWKRSFSLVSWVHGEQDFEKYNIINLKIQYADSSVVNWQLGKQVNNAWFWELKSNKHTLDYKPSSKRQSICSDWIMVSMCFDAEKEEIVLYYNDISVAIYSLEDLVPKATVQTITLQAGGDETGDLSEWESFNGKIDEIRVFNHSLTSSEISKFYSQLKSPLPKTQSVDTKDSLKILTFNIWHGGNETGKAIGYKRIAELIKNADADIVALQETYGSGAKIADELGYYFYLRSSNIAIMSRYPIIETLPSFKPFHHANAKIRIANKDLIFSSVWLNYPIDYWAEIDKGNPIDEAEWKKLQDGNKLTMERIISTMKHYLAQSDTIPIVIAGDFNSGSHLDWTAELKELNAGYVMPFPTTKYLDSLGFKDVFRLIHPSAKVNRGITWTPINAQTHQDRIDYIFMKGKRLKALDATVINHHSIRYPSDHAAVLGVFKFR